MILRAADSLNSRATGTYDDPILWGANPDSRCVAIDRDTIAGDDVSKSAAVPSSEEFFWIQGWTWRDLPPIRPAVF